MPPAEQACHLRRDWIRRLVKSLADCGIAPWVIAGALSAEAAEYELEAAILRRERRRVGVGLMGLFVAWKRICKGEDE
jgi:hypothetical protein